MCVYTCIYICVCVYIYICIQWHTYMCICVCICIYTYTHTHTHKHTRIYMYLGRREFPEMDWGRVWEASICALVWRRLSGSPSQRKAGTSCLDDCTTTLYASSCVMCAKHACRLSVLTSSRVSSGFNLVTVVKILLWALVDTCLRCILTDSVAVWRSWWRFFWFWSVYKCIV